MEEIVGVALADAYERFWEPVRLRSFIERYLTVAARLAGSGLYHNDLSAHNLIVCGDDRVYAIDFEQSDDRSFIDPFAVLLWTIYDILLCQKASYDRDIYVRLYDERGVTRADKAYYPDFSQIPAASPLRSFIARANHGSSWLEFVASELRFGTLRQGVPESDAFPSGTTRPSREAANRAPNMIATEDDVSSPVAKDLPVERLAPDARDILERFAKWDTIRHSVAREVAGNGHEQISSPSHAVAAPTESSGASAGMSSPVAKDLPMPELMRALYRVLLLREPDPVGLNAYMEEIRNGLPIEDAIRRMLKSAEFGEKRAQFSQTDLPPDSFAKKIEFESAGPTGTFELEFVTHRGVGPEVTFALNKVAKDTYTEALRRALPSEHFIPFILRRARRKGSSFKVADFGANVGVVSLPLAASGLRVLAIEAVPANFMALATAARVNGLHNLLPVNMAALDRAGLVSFSGISAWATAGIAGGDVTVSCDTLVNILQTYGFADVDVIKIDIEGAELPALSGADTFFADRPEAEVIFESNNHTCQMFGYDRQDLLRWFLERGFSTYVFRADGLMPIRHDDPQPVPVVDILATKHSAISLQQQGETIVAMTDDYVVQELLRISTSTNPHIQKHFITEAGRVGDSVKNSPTWARIASALVVQ
jgi:FkbM family methyltransferase